MLMSNLDDSVDYRLTLVIANARPSRCTATIQRWASRRVEPVAWCALTAADNHSNHFLRTLVDAVRTIHPPVVTIDPSEDLDTALTDLLNALLALDPPSILVLENYQVIKDPAIHEAVGWVVDYLPPKLHLIVISTSEPPIPNLARLRVRRQLIELRLPDS